MPAEFEIPGADIVAAVDKAIERAVARKIRGKRLTPFLLSEIGQLSEGNTLKTNRALLVNNAEVAALIAARLELG